MPTPIPTIPPPNGERVTQALLYETLYTLDQALAARFTAIMESITSVGRQVQGVTSDLASHKADGHPFTQKSETIREEIRLDTKKAALAAALVAALTVILSKLPDFLQYLRL